MCFSLDRQKERERQESASPIIQLLRSVQDDCGRLRTPLLLDAFLLFGGYLPLNRGLSMDITSYKVKSQVQNDYNIRVHLRAKIGCRRASAGSVLDTLDNFHKSGGCCG